jgi:hypothetical protein
MATGRVDCEWEWESFLTYSQEVGPFLHLFTGSGNLSSLIHREWDIFFTYLQRVGPFLHLFIGSGKETGALFLISLFLMIIFPNGQSS